MGATDNQDTQAVLRSQDYYRLKKIVESSGSIYEVDVGTKAIYLGPESDLSEVQITYYNPEEPNQLETAIVSVNGPFIGRIDTLLATPVSSTHQPARILVAPVELVDNTYQNPNTTPARRFNLPATLDVFFALKDLSTIPAVRPDRTIRLPQVPWNSTGGDTGSTDIYVPIYGRRIVSIQAYYVNPALGNRSALIQCALVSLLPPSGVAHVAPRILGNLFVRSRVQTTAVIRASDAARASVIYDPALAITGYTIEQDQPSNPKLNNTIPPGFSPRGIADLLCLNISGDSAGDPDPKFMNIVIQMSDREN